MKSLQFVIAVLAALFNPLAMGAQAQEAAPRAAAKAAAQPAHDERSLALRMNANTVAVISGTPGGTYFRMASDMAFVLDDGDIVRGPLLDLPGCIFRCAGPMEPSSHLDLLSSRSPCNRRPVGTPRARRRFYGSGLRERSSARPER